MDTKREGEGQAGWIGRYIDIYAIRIDIYTQPILYTIK